MASPTVAGRQASAVTTNSTSHTVTLPGSISAGNLLIAVFSFGITDDGAGNNNTVTWPGDWTPITNGAVLQILQSSEGISTAYKQVDG